MELIFATNNKHKLEELQNILGNDIILLSLNDINCEDEIPEEQDTLEGNASQKSWFIYNKYGKNCFADDTGLEVRSLNNEPGVYSARYAGKEKDANANMEKLVENMKGKSDRYARFRTCISLIINGKEIFFEGQVEGEILKEKIGKDGFGYDPIFKPQGYNISFAEMSMEEKNKISHRGRAVQKLITYLNELSSQNR